MSGFLCRDVASLTQSRWSIRVRQSPGVRLFASSQTLCTRNRALKEKEPATTNQAWANPGKSSQPTYKCG